jgi:hypothetical protein
MGPSANTAMASATSAVTKRGPDAIYSGLPGLDYALGGIPPCELSCVTGPPCMGKTLLLLDLAARIAARYGRNVVFYSAHQPSVYLSRKLATRGGTEITFAGVRDSVSQFGQAIGSSASIFLFDSRSEDEPRALEFACTLVSEHPGGCAAVIMDGWSTYQPPLVNKQLVYKDGTFPAERWSNGLLSIQTLNNVKRFGANFGIPVVIGVTTVSLMDAEAQAQSFEVESELRVRADRLLTLRRPEIYRETAQMKPEERNVVCLTGTSPRWWDTRCSRLRFDPRRLGFSTVV